MIFCVPNDNANLPSPNSIGFIPSTRW
ncbi:hypothetical protein V12B01_13145 [Vibrio splendidus 12B01]|nr:hypothetical protein V12B01_13145 [Vibrio splendidus 12B01]EAQ54997.1 hypothetical protein MED222_05265 [Vibrio sp. MED222]